MNSCKTKYDNKLKSYIPTEGYTMAYQWFTWGINESLQRIESGFNKGLSGLP